MEPYASQLSGSSLGQPLYEGQKRGCSKAAIGKGCAALVSILLLAAAVGLGLYFVGDDEDGSFGGGGRGPAADNDVISGSGDPRDVREGAVDRTPPGGRVDRDDLAPDAPDFVNDPVNDKLIEIPEKGYKPYVLNKYSHKVDSSAMPYPFDEILGVSYLFFEAQRSGFIESEADSVGNRIPWRGDQLTKDGDYLGEGLDFVGGHYEAGNRLKITFASAYFISRTAWSCLYQGNLFSQVQFEGESMLFWCKREMEFAARWMFKAHLYQGSGPRPNKWRKGDRLAVMTGKFDLDFDCYQRAELIPASDPALNCTKEARSHIIADDSQPAAETAGYTAAAMAAIAALFQDSDANLAEEAYAMSQAMYDFALKKPKTGVTWSDQVEGTYPMKASDQPILFAEAMFAYVHSCTGDALMCDKKKAENWATIASQHWSWQFQMKRHNTYMVSFWGNPDYDTALLLTMATGNLTAEPAEILRDYIETHVVADDSKLIGASPKGMRYHESEDWAFLRTSSASAFIASTYASFPGVKKEYQEMCYCYARSQLGYILGDTGLSYVHGYGPNYVQNVHHRDSVCTMDEAESDICADAAGAKFYREEVNAYILHGAVVGGPNLKDQYQDDRNEYKFTEVALDYNTLFSMALAATAAAPPEMWDVDCSKHVDKYPWSDAETAAEATRNASPAPNVGSSAPANDPPSIYDLVENQPAGGGGSGGNSGDQAEEEVTTPPVPEVPPATQAGTAVTPPPNTNTRRLMASA